MGIKLVIAAAEYASENGLGRSERDILTAMAITAKDKDAEPRYYAGRELLAHRSGYLARRPGTPEERRKAFLALKQGTRRLIATKIITRIADGAPGANSIYSLEPLARWSRQRSVTPSELGYPADTPGYPSTHELGYPADTQMGYAADTPKEEDLGIKEEEGAPPSPTKFCKRHASWDHDEACRACMLDRQSAERSESVRALPKAANPSPRLHDLDPLERSQVDNHIRGFGEIPDRLRAAADEARAERERAA